MAAAKRTYSSLHRQRKSQSHLRNPALKLHQIEVAVVVLVDRSAGDFSRFALANDVKSDTTAASISDVVEQTV